MLKRKCLSSFLIVNCSTSSFSYSTYTSKGVKNNKKVIEGSLRTIYATRRCGVGHKVLQKLYGVMYLPPPVPRKKYDNLSNKLGEEEENVAKTSIIESAAELK